MARRRKGKTGVVSRGADTFEAVLTELTKSQGTVQFGFLDGLSSAEAAQRSFYNEYSVYNVLTQRMNPARPHIGPVADDDALVRQELYRAVNTRLGATKMRKQGAKAAGQQLARGGAAAKIIREEMLEALGQMARALAAQVRQNIVNMNDPPNAPWTVERKGFNDPLIETGEMRDNVAWRVRDKSGRIVAEGLVTP